MTPTFDEVKGGYALDADVVVVGSGAGGAVAAANFAKAGLRTVLIEAGPPVTPDEMTRDGKTFLSKYYWEGGLRMLVGSGAYPTMSGRCLGGSTVVNSAITFRLPDWVRKEWIEDSGLSHLEGPALDAAYDRMFEAVSAAPTPLDVMGRKNEVCRDVLDAAGVPNKPLPRAVKGCIGAGDCLTGCRQGAKQSVDRSILPQAAADGAQIMPWSHAERILFEDGRAVGVEGRVVRTEGRVQTGRFTVRAPKVVVAAGALHTPVLLQRSGVTLRGRVGGTFAAHVAGLALGVMPEPVQPWRGATQGWGGFSPHVRGLKFEALWGPTALMAAEWGGVGPSLYRMMPDIEHAAMVVLVYRARTKGSVRAKRNGMPDPRLWIPAPEVAVVTREAHRLTEAFLKVGARYVFTGVKGLPDRIERIDQAQGLLSPHLRGRHLTMTANHVFCSCPMGPDPDRSVVGLDGRVHGVPGVWIADASVFPSPSAVNPQMTVMAMADMISRQAADLPLV